MHHRRHSGAGHGAGQARADRQQQPADRSQLPRHHHPGRMQDRHHAGTYPYAGQGWYRVAFGNADL